MIRGYPSLLQGLQRDKYTEQTTFYNLVLSVIPVVEHKCVALLPVAALGFKISMKFH